MGADESLFWSDRLFAYFISDYSRSTQTTLTRLSGSIPAPL